MKWFELVEDLGERFSPQRFRTLEEAEKYEYLSEGWVIESVYEVDTDSPYFYTEPKDEDEQ